MSYWLGMLSGMVVVLLAQAAALLICWHLVKVEAKHWLQGIR